MNIPINEPTELNVADGLRLALGLLADGHHAEAEDIFAKVAAADPGNFEALQGRALALQGLEHHAPALAVFDQAMAICRDQLLTLTLNRSVSLAEIGESDKAMDAVNRVIAAAPHNWVAYLNRGLINMQMGLYQLALLDLDESLRLNPENDKALFGKGFCNLVLGNLRAGFTGYEHRLRDSIIEPPAPEWRGFDDIEDALMGSPTGPGMLKGKTILVHGEQGFGDSIMFGRFLPMLVAEGASVLAYLTKPVQPLFDGTPGVTMVDGEVARGRAGPKFDYWVRMMSLAHCFGVDESTVPEPLDLSRFLPQLNPATDHLRATLLEGAPEGTRLIGVCWAGSRKSRYDAHRTIPFDRLPLWVRGVRFVPLQEDVREEDREAYFAAIEAGRLVPPPRKYVDFGITAEVISALDGVISVDTSVLHLAGSLGVPTFAMISAFRAYWVWIQNRTDNPWYPSIEVFKQRRDGDWGDVVDRVSSRLVAGWPHA
jgi:hypothetical protein